MAYPHVKLDNPTCNIYTQYIIRCLIARVKADVSLHSLCMFYYKFFTCIMSHYMHHISSSCISWHYHMWLSEQKPDMFAHKLIFILFPQLIATLNNYACSMPPQANFDWSAFPDCFCRPCKSTTSEIALKEGSNLAVGTWYGSHCHCTSV